MCKKEWYLDRLCAIALKLDISKKFLDGDIFLSKKFVWKLPPFLTSSHTSIHQRVKKCAHQSQWNMRLTLEFMMKCAKTDHTKRGLQPSPADTLLIFLIWHFSKKLVENRTSMQNWWLKLWYTSMLEPIRIKDKHTYLLALEGCFGQGTIEAVIASTFIH